MVSALKHIAVAFFLLLSPTAEAVGLLRYEFKSNMDPVAESSIRQYFSPLFGAMAIDSLSAQFKFIDAYDNLHAPFEDDSYLIIVIVEHPKFCDERGCRFFMLEGDAGIDNWRSLYSGYSNGEAAVSFDVARGNLSGMYFGWCIEDNVGGQFLEWYSGRFNVVSYEPNSWCP